MNGGPFSVRGDFWSVVAPVQTPGSSVLANLSTGTNAVVFSWPSPSAGLHRQQEAGLTTNWHKGGCGSLLPPAAASVDGGGHAQAQAVQADEAGGVVLVVGLGRVGFHGGDVRVVEADR
jgi:hypothetical protein